MNKWLPSEPVSMAMPTRNAGSPRAIESSASLPSAPDPRSGGRPARVRAALVLLLPLFCLLPVRAQVPHVGLFKNVAGEVKIERNHALLAAAPGTMLETMDVVVSGPNASAGLAFVDGTLLTVGPSTRIEISGYRFEPDKAEYDFSIYLRKGSLVYASGKLGKLAPGSVRVNTPRAVIGVRGTHFLVESN